MESETVIVYDEQNLENDINIIETWLSQQIHLNARKDRKFLEFFIRSCKYRLEIVKEKLDYYFTYRTICPEYYLNRTPIEENVKKLIKAHAFIYYPKINPTDKARIFICRPIEIKNNECSVLDMLRGVLMIHDRIGFSDDNLMNYGSHTLVDFKGASLSIAHEVIPHLKKLVTAIQSAYPLRVAKIHFVNLNEVHSIYSIVLRTFQKFLKPKLASRIKIHDDYNSLHNCIPKDLLPIEYGGQAGTLTSIMEQAGWEEKLLGKDAQLWFKNDEQYRSDESKRIGEFKGNDLFGLEGSFKKLEID